MYEHGQTDLTPPFQGDFHHFILELGPSLTSAQPRLHSKLALFPNHQFGEMCTKKRLTCLLLSMVLATLEINAVQANGHKQKFGDGCSKNKKCDFTKWLRCEDGKCVCFQNNKEGRVNLYYDPVSERCVGRSGTNCSQKVRNQAELKK